jgi:hypothetical protein
MPQHELFTSNVFKLFTFVAHEMRRVLSFDKKLVDINYCGALLRFKRLFSWRLFDFLLKQKNGRNNKQEEKSFW